MLLALTPHGAVLFDSIAYIDDATVSVISNILGPQKLAAIVISHPHFYNSMTLWSRRFGCPVYVHADDAEWIPADDKEFVTLWKGDTLPIFNQHAKREENGKRVFGAEAIHVGGHFAGSTVCIVQTTGASL